jgi:UDP-N-acetylmuramate--alanine ligase
MSERVHLIGIGGIGVSGVARAYHALGYEVSGSDRRPSSITEALTREGVKVTIGHTADNVAGVDRVVVSTAIPEDNPEIVAARAQGIMLEHRSHSLDRVVRHFTSVGVSGTNGKGTVSSMITAALEAWGVEPSFIIGGMLRDYGTNARLTGSKYLVAEVDESDGSLVNVHPSVAVLCNLELDHLNYYKSFDEVLDKVEAFLVDNTRLDFAVIQTSDEGSRRLLARVADRVRAVTFSADAAHPAAYMARDIQHEGLRSSFTVVHEARGELGRVELSVPGLYNVENALSAIATAVELGAPFERAAAGLASYQGLDNRFTVAEAGDSLVVKDYMSHPTGMRRVLAALRHHVGDSRRLIAVFKPYRYTMIHYLGDEYARCFEDADETLITEMWEAGEEPMPGVNTEYLVDKIRAAGSPVNYIQDMADIPPHILKEHAGSVAVIFFGGDDLFAEADGLARALEARA